MASSATLPERFVGELIRPHDARYDEARSLFNGLIDKHPALIARCANSRTSGPPCATPGRTTSSSPSAAAGTRARATRPVTAASSSTSAR